MSRTLDLGSVAAKIWRANEHFQVLNKEIDDFVNPDLYKIRTETYRQGVERRHYLRHQIEKLGLREAFPFRQIDDDTLELFATVDYKSILATVPSDIPATRWSIIAGDVISNVRAALDHLVWALTVANGNTPPPVPFGKWRRVEFPVERDPAKWRDTAKKHLWGVRPRDQTRLKKLQPFYRRKSANIDRHWLHRLNELWNTDKHRVLNLTRAYHGWQTMELVPAEVHEHVAWRLLRARDYGPFKQDTEEIARVRLMPRRDRPPFRNREFKMDVKVRLTFEVTFDDGPPGYGANVVTLLKGFLNEVAGIVYEFQPDLREPLPVNLLLPPAIHASPPPEQEA